MRKFILSLIALSIISLAFADTEITNKPANLQFPNMQRLIKCIKSFGKFTDEMAVEFKEMFALIANGEFYKAYLALKSLSEPAKQVYYDCKFLTETRRVRSQLDRPMYMLGFGTWMFCIYMGLSNCDLTLLVSVRNLQS